MQSKSKILPGKMMVEGHPLAHNYPSGTTIRNLISSSLVQQRAMMDCLSDNDAVAPWVLMLVSRATANLNTVDEFLSYYYMSNKNSNALSGLEPNIMEELSKHVKSGHMVRSLLYSSMFRQQNILKLITDTTEVPPWIVMKVSRATDALNSAAEYVISAYRKV
jgi:hypothetical protein